MKKKLLIPICLLLMLSMVSCCSKPVTQPASSPTRVSIVSGNGRDNVKMPETEFPGKYENEMNDRQLLPTTEPTVNAKTDRQKHTEMPVLYPKATETIKPEPTQTPTPTPEPEMDIGYWVAYAKDFATSEGLILDSNATDCWDNPITANSKCRYLERDIQNILNRYSRDEDITAVWIWSEALGNGNYNIYIGYA